MQPFYLKVIFFRFFSGKFAQIWEKFLSFPKLFLLLHLRLTPFCITAETLTRVGFQDFFHVMLRSVVNDVIV